MARDVSELTLSTIWRTGQLPREMRTTDGRRIEVMYPGAWTHSDGPDFRDALMSLDGRVVRGSVELHLRASDWRRHGHDQDDAYNSVVLHVVMDDDVGVDIQQPAGRSIPTLALRAFLPDTVRAITDVLGAGDLGSIGKRTCLPTLAGSREQLIRDALRRAGWERLLSKQMRFAQEMERMPPEDVLFRGLLDGLGLTQNREGMAAVAESLPLSVLESVRHLGTPHGATALLLGTGGFLPLSPVHQALAEVGPDTAIDIEILYDHLARQYNLRRIPAERWILRRVRPQSHPVRRLASLSSLFMSSRNGILDDVLMAGLSGRLGWRDWLSTAKPAIGQATCDRIAINICAPFLAALADLNADNDLMDHVGTLWETLPGAADDAVARETLQQIVGSRRFPIRTALESQGLHQIGRNGCREFRCFECPIAALAVTHEPSHFI